MRAGRTSSHSPWSPESSSAPPSVPVQHHWLILPRKHARRDGIARAPVQRLEVVIVTVDGSRVSRYVDECNPVRRDGSAPVEDEVESRAGEVVLGDVDDPFALHSGHDGDVAELPPTPARRPRRRRAPSGRTGSRAAARRLASSTRPSSLPRTSRFDSRCAREPTPRRTCSCTRSSSSGRRRRGRRPAGRTTRTDSPR